MRLGRSKFSALISRAPTGSMLRRRLITGIAASGLLSLGSLTAPGSSLAFADTSPVPDAGWSLKSYIGLERERAQLFAGGAHRQRALRRLAGTSSAQAHEAARVLDVWLETEPLLTLNERLELARALAPLASQSAAKRRLREFFSAAAEPAHEASVELKMARQVAALGLARNGDAASLQLLGQWLRREPEIATVAANAIRAYPPRALHELLNAAGPTTPTLLEVLGELGDTRAYEFLSRTLKRATPDVQANAALALARLGVSETVDVAHYWLETKGVALDLLTAATEILFVFDEPRRHYAFDLLLSRSPTRALDVALHHPSPAVVELGEHIHTFEDAERQNALLRLLSHAGGSGTRYVIEAFQSSPELRSQAAFLLAHSPEPSAHEALRRAVNQPEQRAEALRALILSQAYQNTDAPELNQGLERALTKGSSTERAIARFGLAVRSESQARQLLKSRAPAELEAAASVFWWHGEAYRRACVQRLAQLSSHPLSKQALALAPALSAPGPSASIPVSLLVAWAHSGLPVALPAGWQLASRALPAYESLLLRLLESPDYELRAATYLGLGLNPEPKYTGILVRALSTELNPDVRLSIAVALRARPAVPASETALEYARRYDPSTSVRELLLRGHPQAKAKEAVWIDLDLVQPSTSYIALSSSVRSPIALQVSNASAVTLVGVDDADSRWRSVHQPFIKP